MQCDSRGVFVECSGKSPIERNVNTVVVKKVCFWHLSGVVWRDLGD